MPRAGFEPATSNRTAAELHLRPRGHNDKLLPSSRRLLARSRSVSSNYLSLRSYTIRRHVTRVAEQQC
jgi:hypothetical protein